MARCSRDSKNARLLIRSREQRDTWGRKQVFECWTCGSRWSE